jgi:hypothetical protein
VAYLFLVRSMRTPLLVSSLIAFLIPLPWGIEFALIQAFPKFAGTFLDAPFGIYRFFVGNSLGLLFYLCVALLVITVFALITRRISGPIGLACILLSLPLLCFSYWVVFLSHWT